MPAKKKELGPGIRMSLRLRPDIHRGLERHAKKMKRTKTTVIELALAAYLQVAPTVKSNRAPQDNLFD